MQYLITFLEGLISFISPCTLPMLPVYVSYFAGGEAESRRIFPRALSFVLGFTLVFSLLGLFAGTLGAALSAHRRVVDVVCGALVIVFGLSFLGLIPLRFFRGVSSAHDAGSVLSAFVFGMIYSLSLTPCIGAFLGSALMLAASVGGAWRGFLLLLVYSLGMGVPFVLSAVLIDRLRGAFSFIKRHYRTVNLICGCFLIVVGIAMILGWLNRLLALFS